MITFPRVVLDSDRCYVLNFISWSIYVPPMYIKNTETLIKFLSPNKLKRALQELAKERNVTLSSLLRLILSEYVKRNQTS